MRSESEIVPDASAADSEIRALARQFAEAELRPHVEAWDRDRALGSGVFAQLAQLGFFGMLAPEAHGGLDFDLPTYLAVLEEIARGEPVAALALSIHNAAVIAPIRRHGSPAQQERWLAPLASGELIGCFALSEPEAGSDAAGIATRAVRDGNGWILEGEKRWVSLADVAGLALVLARTDSPEDPRGAHGLGAFLVPADSPGFERGEREETMGLRAAAVLRIRLHGVRLPADALLGEPDRGFACAMEALDLGRLGIAAQATGIARAAFEHARDYAAVREQFGRKIKDFEGIQFKLADMATRIEAARALLAHAAAAPSTGAAAMAKLFASETAMAVTTQAVQVFGGYGYMRDYPVEKLMRDAKATEIYEGTNEILRVVIARGLYRPERPGRL